MKMGFCWIFAIATLFTHTLTTSAAERYVSPAGSHLPPFTDWVGAATNIQDAIDVAEAGDLIWVTNGIYADGGKVMAGDLTNRVALDKALTVQSVNGPRDTIIQGGGLANGVSAVRCAWLTNGATLRGFTLQDGHTRAAGDNTTLQNGGGAWCAATNGCLLANCLVRSNSASSSGGGVFQGQISNSIVTRNSARLGGGVEQSLVINSAVLTNSASQNGGGLAMAEALNCTIVGNNAVSGGGAFSGRLTNCIIYFNSGPTYSNAANCLVGYSCTTPSSQGVGNISANPQLLGDAITLANSSPCHGAGTFAATTGVDLHGNPWANPPSMGCTELSPVPVVVRPRLQLTTDPVGFRISADVAGQEPLTFWWTRDSTPLQDNDSYSGVTAQTLVARDYRASDAGNYQLVVSNAAGVAVSEPVPVVIHFVDLAAPSSEPPYLGWPTAATNIQDAIDLALPGEIVLVTNGNYTAGGKVMAGGLLNRVALDKPLAVQSVNGPEATIISGEWDPATNGPAAVRCAWLTNGAVLSRFTLRDGATRAWNATLTQQMNGGGAWGSSTNARVDRCLITQNAASSAGGGAYQVFLTNCRLTGNAAADSSGNGSGGGAANCRLQNCAVAFNTANKNGGGAVDSTLINCTLTWNNGGYNSVGGGYGGGVYQSSLTNCVAIRNQIWSGISNGSNYFSSTFSYSCTMPVPTGTGNRGVDPRLLPDNIHLAEDSPCRGAGTQTAVQGSDLDQQAWNTPPSMGCDEWQPIPVCILPATTRANGPVGEVWLSGVAAAGQAPFTWSWLKDGTLLSNGPKYDSADTTNLIVHAFSPSDAGDYQAIVSNAVGVATSAVARVTVHCVDVAGSNPLPPYAAWATAATNIQDAIDTAAAGDVVLVTNGLYASGGKMMDGDLLNRVALDKPLVVMSVNGAEETLIQGAWDPATTNGPLAVRCAWLTNGATLNGFTLLNGATRTNGPTALTSGGGLWGVGSSAIAVNCRLTNNAAAVYGGGACSGILMNCWLRGNQAANGGGAGYVQVLNSWITGNRAASRGGGFYAGRTVNCTVTGNTAGSSGGGGFLEFVNSAVFNSIVFGNSAPTGAGLYPAGLPVRNSCVVPAYSAPGNISADPQLLDGLHLAITSPCRGAGNSTNAAGTDIDGEPWAGPPSIGCDEVWEDALVGPLAVSAFATPTEIAQTGTALLQGVIEGRAARVAWDFGDGTVLTNASYLSPSHVWTNTGDYTVTFTAFNADHPNGVSTDLVVHVMPLLSPSLAAASFNANTFTLSFDSQLGISYLVEQTTNLAPPVVWSPVWSGVGTGGPLSATDTKATNEMRFYRLRTQ